MFYSQFILAKKGPLGTIWIAVVLLYEGLKKEGLEVEQGYKPDSWIPHSSVAQDVPRSRMADAFAVLLDQKLPVSGYAMDIGLVELSPVREIFSFPLGSSVDA